MNSDKNNSLPQNIRNIIYSRIDKSIDKNLENIENLEKPTGQQTDKIFASILSEIHQPEISKGDKQASKSNIIHLARKYAAAVILLLVSVYAVSLWLQPNETYIKTNYAENKKIILPDGSKVILNANSSLTFSNDWEENDDRKVWLDGEGYFSVEKGIKKGQKFEVITKDISVVVLGTIFNVNSRKDKVEIFLEEGKISLVTKEDKSKTKDLKPGDFVRYVPNSKEINISQKTDKIQNVSSWKDGAILFNEASLSDVLKKLNEIYGVEFEIGNKDILNKKISAGIPVEQLDVAIKMLSDVLDVEIELVSQSKYKLN
jgi:ferric-dicitrate binding protein FerR (iron transport regulator)